MRRVFWELSMSFVKLFYLQDLVLFCERNGTKRKVTEEFGVLQESGEWDMYACVVSIEDMALCRRAPCFARLQKLTRNKLAQSFRIVILQRLVGVVMICHRNRSLTSLNIAQTIAKLFWQWASLVRLQQTWVDNGLAQLHSLIAQFCQRKRFFRNSMVKIYPCFSIKTRPICNIFRWDRLE